MHSKTPSWMRLIRYPSHVRLRHPVATGYGSRRHRHPDGGGTPTECHAGKQPRSIIGRDEFVERVWEWKGSSPADMIAKQIAPTRAPRWIGNAMSLPWTRHSVRIGHRSVRAPLPRGADLSRQTPGELGPSTEDSVCRIWKSLSEDEKGSLWHLRYPLSRWQRTSGGGDHPSGNFILGDAAVAVHPDDERYRALDRPTRFDCRSRTRELPIIGGPLRRSGLRERLRQDHAGTRFQRLRGRSSVTTCRCSTS